MRFARSASPPQANKMPPLNEWVWASGWWWFCAGWGKTWSYETYPPCDPGWWVFDTSAEPEFAWTWQNQRPDLRTGRREIRRDFEQIRRELREAGMRQEDDDYDAEWSRRIRRTCGAGPWSGPVPCCRGADPTRASRGWDEEGGWGSRRWVVQKDQADLRSGVMIGPCCRAARWACISQALQRSTSYRTLYIYIYIYILYYTIYIILYIISYILYYILCIINT